MGKLISGIQQVGIGNPNMEKAWAGIEKTLEWIFLFLSMRLKQN